MKSDVYCRLCGGLCLTKPERTLKMCYGCGIKSQTREKVRLSRPGYKFQRQALK